jgi:LPS sulfotransferase NodH
MNCQISEHMHFKYDRFVVVGHARTGSNLLLSGLGKSKYVKMFDEPFASHNRKPGEDYDKIIASLFYQIPLLITHVGFKLFYYHLRDDEWNRFLNGDQFKIIHLTRRNYLRTIISLEIASKTSQWIYTKSHNKITHKTITIDSEKILQRIKNIAEQETLFRTRVRDWETLEVVYEDFVRDLKKEFKRICYFLKIPDIRILRIRLKKQNPEPLSKLIKNFDEIVSVLRQTDFSECLEG